MVPEEQAAGIHSWPDAGRRGERKQRGTWTRILGGQQGRSDSLESIQRRVTFPPTTSPHRSCFLRNQCPVSPPSIIHHPSTTIYRVLSPGFSPTGQAGAWPGSFKLPSHKRLRLQSRQYSARSSHGSIVCAPTPQCRPSRDCGFSVRKTPCSSTHVRCCEQSARWAQAVMTIAGAYNKQPTPPCWKQRTRSGSPRVGRQRPVSACSGARPRSETSTVRPNHEPPPSSPRSSPLTVPGPGRGATTPTPVRLQQRPQNEKGKRLSPTFPAGQAANHIRDPRHAGDPDYQSISH